MTEHVSRKIWELPAAIQLEINSRDDADMGEWLKDVVPAFTVAPGRQQQDFILALRLLAVVNDATASPERDAAVDALYERYGRQVPTQEAIQEAVDQLAASYRAVMPGSKALMPCVGIAFSSFDGMRFRRYSLLPSVLNNKIAISPAAMLSVCVLAGIQLAATGHARYGFPMAGFMATDSFAVMPDAEVTPELIQSAVDGKEIAGIQRTAIIQVSALGGRSVFEVIPHRLGDDGIEVLSGEALKDARPVNAISAIMDRRSDSGASLTLIERTVLVSYLREMLSVSLDWCLEIFE